MTRCDWATTALSIAYHDHEWGVPLHDDRVRENPAYLTVVLLARVITRIGTVDDIHAGVIEDLFAAETLDWMPQPVTAEPPA